MVFGLPNAQSHRLALAACVLALAAASAAAAADIVPNPDASPNSVTLASYKSSCPQSAEILAQINAARSDPQAYARAWAEDEGAAGAQEALDFLISQQPLPTLQDNARLEQAALRHAADEQRQDPPQHIGSDGSDPKDRILATGVYSYMMAEEIAVGESTAAGVVRQLILDPGNKVPHHRLDLFNPRLAVVGIACATSQPYGEITVIDLTAQIQDRG